MTSKMFLTRAPMGRGRTGSTLTLAPGKPTLQRVPGNPLHIPFNPVVRSGTITITVTQ